MTTKYASRQKIVSRNKGRTRNDIDRKEVQAFLNRPVQKVENLNLNLKKSYEKGFFDKPVFQHFKILKSKRHNKDKDSVQSQENDEDSDFQISQTRRRANVANLNESLRGKRQKVNKGRKGQKVSNGRKGQKVNRNYNKQGRQDVVGMKGAKKEESGESLEQSQQYEGSSPTNSEQQQSEKKLAIKKITKKNNSSSSSSSSSSDQSNSHSESEPSLPPPTTHTQTQPTTQSNKQHVHKNHIQHEQEQEYIQSTTKQQEQPPASKTFIDPNSNNKTLITPTDNPKNKKTKISLKKSGKFIKQPKESTQTSNIKMKKAKSSESASESYLIPAQRYKNKIEKEDEKAKQGLDVAGSKGREDSEYLSSEQSELLMESEKRPNSKKKSDKISSSLSSVGSGEPITKGRRQSNLRLTSAVVWQRLQQMHEAKLMSPKKQPHLTFNSRIIIESILVVNSHPTQLIHESYLNHKIKIINSLFQHAPCCPHANTQFRKKTILQDQDAGLSQSHQRKRVAFQGNSMVQKKGLALNTSLVYGCQLQAEPK